MSGTTVYEAVKFFVATQRRNQRRQQTDTLNQEWRNTMSEYYTDEEIQTRFDAAEARTKELEQLVLAETPADVVDKFRIGDDKELFGTLLTAPGYELDDGVYAVQASVDADVEADVAPYELVLMRSYVGPTNQMPGAKHAFMPVHGKVIVALRTEAPTREALVQEGVHYIVQPESWEQVRDWARALRAMNVADWE